MPSAGLALAHDRLARLEAHRLEQLLEGLDLLGRRGRGRSGARASGSGPGASARAPACGEELVLRPLERRIEVRRRRRAASAPRGRGCSSSCRTRRGWRCALDEHQALVRGRRARAAGPMSRAPAPPATRVTRFRSTIAIAVASASVEDLRGSRLDGGEGHVALQLVDARALRPRSASSGLLGAARAGASSARRAGRSARAASRAPAAARAGSAARSRARARGTPPRRARCCRARRAAARRRRCRAGPAAPRARRPRRRSWRGCRSRTATRRRSRTCRRWSSPRARSAPARRAMARSLRERIHARRSRAWRPSG